MYCWLEMLCSDWLILPAVEQRLLRRIVDIEDLEEDAEADGNQDEDIHLHPLLQCHTLAEGLQCGHSSLVHLSLDP